MGYSDKIKKWVGNWMLADGNGNVVKRSNAVLDYGTKLIYREALIYPSFFTGFIFSFGMVLAGLMLACFPLRWLLRNCCLPKPGQGPSKEQMDAGYLKLTCFAKGESG